MCGGRGNLIAGCFVMSTKSNFSLYVLLLCLAVFTLQKSSSDRQDSWFLCVKDWGREGGGEGEGRGGGGIVEIVLADLFDK
jgi:hypothetical protein